MRAAFKARVRPLREGWGSLSRYWGMCHVTIRPPASTRRAASANVNHFFIFPVFLKLPPIRGRNTTPLDMTRTGVFPGRPQDSTGSPLAIIVAIVIPFLILMPRNG